MKPFQEVNGEFVLRDATIVRAPIDLCFQLTCAIALVREELGMTPVSGRTTGFVTGGDMVRWEGWQLGWKHFHVSHISSYERPVFMQDTMADGRFKTFQHDHHLRESADGTVMEDELRFTLPFGLPGRLVGRLILAPHVQRLMKRRFARIKGIAETDRWREYLPAVPAPV